MDEIYQFFDGQLKVIEFYQPAFFRVVRYTLGHQMLIIMVEPENNPSNQRHFLVFEGIEYMQLLPSWKRSPIKLALPEKQDFIFQLANINVAGRENPPMVFYAKPEGKELYIICSNMYSTEKMPKLYEYTW